MLDRNPVYTQKATKGNRGTLKLKIHSFYNVYSWHVYLEMRTRKFQKYTR